jgi:hypothetical protein
MKIISREEARVSGLKFFYTGKPCVRGHDCERYVAVGRCIKCDGENCRRFQAANKEAVQTKQREYRQRDPEKRRQQKRADYLKNRERYRQTNKAWHIANREKALAYLRQWQATNAEYFKQQKTVYYLARKQADPKFAMLTRLRRRINHFVSGDNKSATTAELIGCSYEFFIEHIESLFTPGMTWDNRSKWHIDHIIPCAAFDLSDPAQRRTCFHYTNMRPLWAKENQAKGAKLV